MTVEKIDIRVVNIRNGKEGVAEQFDDGKWNVIFDDNTQTEVSPATFKRWYKVLDQEAAQEVAEELKDVPAAPADQAPVQGNKPATQTTPAANVPNPFDGRFTLITREFNNSRAVGSVNTTTLLMDQQKNELIAIKDHDGFIVDVAVFTHEGQGSDSKLKLLYRSPKASVGHTLTEYYGFTGDDLVHAKRKIAALRKEGNKILAQGSAE